MSRVLVLGRSGQVASELRRLEESNPKYKFVGKEEFGSITELIKTFDPDFVINCAAYTAVDKAETERDAAFAANHDLPLALARQSAELGFHLIHFSTDYVFDGMASKPYRETDAVSPINIYGESKLAGELAIQAEARSATIVRTSWVYSEFGSNFPKTMLRLAKDRPELTVVADQKGCPTWAGDLALLASRQLLEKTEQVELFHFSGNGETTWYDFARTIFQEQKVRCEVFPILTSQYPTPAKRPAYSVMSKEKIENRFGIEISDWKISLKTCFSKWETM